jgi:hypothetical protein
MSRVLPANPNLEHLKNQAKDLLRAWQQHEPDAQLADAQHAIARAYGFASWPRLKAHVEALTADSRSRASERPFVGAWTANLAASRRHPANPFQAATLQFAVAGDSVTITHTGLGASGQAEHSVNTILANGSEVPSGQSGYVVIARWLGTHILETVAKKDGRIVGQGRYEVSLDGTTLTVSTTMPAANADGWGNDFDQVLVFERVARS